LTHFQDSDSRRIVFPVGIPLFQEFLVAFMAHEVVVTRRGQTTIPTKIRQRLGIHEGTRLKVVSDGEKVILTKVPSLFDLAGTSKMTRVEAFKRLDNTREEE